MTTSKTGNSQVNVAMDENLLSKLDIMCKSDEHNRSQFIRKLIRREWLRRQEAGFLPEKKSKTSLGGKNFNEKNSSN